MLTIKFSDIDSLNCGEECYFIIDRVNHLFVATEKSTTDTFTFAKLFKTQDEAIDFIKSLEIPESDTDKSPKFVYDFDIVKVKLCKSIAVLRK